MRSLRFSGVRALGLIAGALVVLAVPANAGAVTASSTFTAGDEGWRVAGTTACDAPVPVAPTFSLTGGAPGGYISATDQEPPTGGFDACLWSALAPPTYAGQMRANYGGTFSYHVRHPAGADFGGTVVFVDGDGNALSGELDPPPAANVWSNQSFTLTETSPATWTYSPNGGTDVSATRAHFFDVLADVSYMLVGGDLSGNSTGDTTGIDTVSLTQAPVPLDTDGDGVTNATDNCPLVVGSAANSGCPVAAPPPDGDGDGVPNASDACPTQPGPAAGNGCPPAVAATDAACETAQKKLAKAKKTLKLLQRSDASEQAIKKAKKKLKKAKAAVKKACA